MFIATWNVNSIRARLERLLRWLAVHRPDVVCLQEVKVEEAGFPFDALREAGYVAEVCGQRTYNGVAILSRSELIDVQRGFPGETSDSQARFIAATTDGVRVVSVYVPNGSVVGSDAYLYKLKWLLQLNRYLETCDLASSALVLCGDLNIAPGPGDVARPDQWEGTVLYNEELRGEFAELLALGLVDTVGRHFPEGGQYSWWDYRQLSFPRNNGLRIDHILAAPALAAGCTEAGIDREARKGPSPSDHAPVWAVFDAGARGLTEP